MPDLLRLRVDAAEPDVALSAPVSSSSSIVILRVQGLHSGKNEANDQSRKNSCHDGLSSSANQCRYTGCSAWVTPHHDEHRFPPILFEMYKKIICGFSTDLVFNRSAGTSYGPTSAFTCVSLSVAPLPVLP